MFFTREFANTLSTKALIDFATLHDSQPTPAWLSTTVAGLTNNQHPLKIVSGQLKSYQNCHHHHNSNHLEELNCNFHHILNVVVVSLY